jgi:hypothetical protein
MGRRGVGAYLAAEMKGRNKEESEDGIRSDVLEMSASHDSNIIRMRLEYSSATMPEMPKNSGTANYSRERSIG